MFHKGVMGLAWMAKNQRSIATYRTRFFTVPIGRRGSPARLDR
jgi:hypothetical protein